MYKTKYTLARHTNSEEYLKVKTKHIHIKLVHKTKPNIFFILCEIMSKTKYILPKHTNSEEYLKGKTKLEWKIYLQNVKPDVKAKM